MAMQQTWQYAAQSRVQSRSQSYCKGDDLLSVLHEVHILDDKLSKSAGSNTFNARRWDMSGQFWVR
jgi:hypothetical protein